MAHVGSSPAAAAAAAAGAGSEGAGAGSLNIVIEAGAYIRPIFGST